MYLKTIDIIALFIPSVKFWIYFKKIKKTIDNDGSSCYYIYILRRKELMKMFLIKKVLIYLVHRQAQDQVKLRQKHNKEQIALILRDLL